MGAEMVNRKKQASDLRQRIVESMKCDLGISEAMAQPFVDSIMRCFSGEQLYFPTAQRVYLVDEMRADLVEGMSVSFVLAKYNVSRSKLHSLFPGGLPKRAVTDESVRASVKTKAKTLFVERPIVPTRRGLSKLSSMSS